MLYAVVDIETTGSHASGNGITEIAILVYNGEKIVETFETLINPEQPIPAYIEALTNISNEMVAHAPVFEEIAEQIYTLLYDKVFVAHNVNFDFSFVRHHLAQFGFHLQCKKLCTLRLSRKIFPGERSYSLGKLCSSLNIVLNNRHRAGGDATATAILLGMLIKKDEADLIALALNRGSKDQVLPPHLPTSQIERLPQNPGVYYFKNQKGEVIYVGKAKNIKKRVCSHFTGNNTGKQRQDFLQHIHHIDFEVCGTELMAFIIEVAEIKRLWPENNKALKHYEQKYCLFYFEDQKGYLRLGVDLYKKQHNRLFSFNSLLDGHNLLKTLVKEHKLCERLCFIQKNRTACTAHAEGNCGGACIGTESAACYNVRVKYAMKALKYMLPTFALIDQGRTEGERSCLWVEEGKFHGMGYIPAHNDLNDLESIKSIIKPYPSNDYILNLIMNHADHHPEKKLLITGYSYGS